MPGSQALRVIDSPDGASSALHPLRRRILQSLAEPGSASAVAKRVGVSRQKANYHVRQLEAEGLIELVEERRKGNCTERIMRATADQYLVDPAVLGALTPNPGRVRDRSSSAYLVAVVSRVLHELVALRRRAGFAKKKLATMTLDTTITFESAASQQVFAEEMAQAVLEVVARHHKPESSPGRRFRLIMGSYPAPREGGAS